MIRYISSGDIHSNHGMLQGKSFVNRHSMSDPITAVQDEACGSSRGVETQDSLGREVQCGGIESLEEDFRSLLSIGIRVEWGFGQEHLAARESSK